MGLWDLQARSDDLVRVPTSLLDEYKQLVASGSTSVGTVTTNTSSTTTHGQREKGELVTER
jgi:hypothetical protein